MNETVAGLITFVVALLLTIPFFLMGAIVGIGVAGSQAVANLWQIRMQKLYNRFTERRVA